MSLLGLILALLVLLGAGFGISRLLASGEPRQVPEVAALSWIFGAGYVSLGLWLGSLLIQGRWLVGAVAGGAVIAMISRTPPAPSHSCLRGSGSLPGCRRGLA